MPARRLGAWAATALVVSEVVGVGIFLTPAAMMRTLGGLWAPLALWLVMGTLTASGALCYAELATRFPRAGGTYVFLREGCGRRTAFVYGWMALLVMDPGITAALGIGLAQYTLATLGAPPTLTPAVAMAGIVLFALLATRGLETNTRTIRWSATLKLVIVCALIATGLWRFVGGEPVASGPVALTGGMPALAGAVIASFFAFGGWWDLGRMSEEVEQPLKTLPFALIVGVLVVTAIYAVVTLTFMMVAPSAGVGSDEAFVAAAGTALFGSAAGRVLSAMVVVTVAGSLAAVLLGAPRTYFAMARDGFLPQGVVWFDSARGSSPAGTAVQASLACLLVALGSFDQILGYFVPVAVFFLGLSAATVLRFPRPSADSPLFRAPWQPLPLVAFTALIALMLVLFAVGQPTQTSLGVGVVLAGLAASRWAVR